MTLRSKIESLASDFTNGILAAIRECSLEELMDGQKLSRAPATDRADKPARAKSSGRLARRSAEDIEKAANDIVALVKMHKDGMRAEEIRKELGIDKREWMRPLQAALDSKRLKKQGEKRATVYMVAGSTGATSSKPAKKKPAAKKAAPKAKAKAKTKKAPKAKVKAKKSAPKAKSNGAAVVTKAEHAAPPPAE